MKGKSWLIKSDIFKFYIWWFITFFYLYFFFLRREGQAANESVNWSLLCIPPSSMFATLNFVFVVTQLLRMSEDISKFWFVHQRQNMNCTFFFFYIFLFFSFKLVPFFFYMSNLKMWTTESWLYDSKHKISACPTTSTDYYYYFSYRKHFQETIGTFIFSYSPDKAFLHIPVKNHQ